jgi:ribosomal protein L24E
MNMTDHTCPMCGKNFIPSVQHLYKSQDKQMLVFCSYTCWRRYLAEKENEKNFTKTT